MSGFERRANTAIEAPAEAGNSNFCSVDMMAGETIYSLDSTENLVSVSTSHELSAIISSQQPNIRQIS